MCIVYSGRCLFQFFVSKIHVELMQVEYSVEFTTPTCFSPLAALHVKLVEWQLKQQAALDNFHFRFVKQVVSNDWNFNEIGNYLKEKIFPSKFWSWYFSASALVCHRIDWNLFNKFHYSVWHLSEASLNVHKPHEHSI